MKDWANLDEFIQSALREDIGIGDITANACLDPLRISKAYAITRDAGIIAGLELARKIFNAHNSSIKFSTELNDGARVEPGNVLFEVEGPQTDLLTAERVVLNSMQRMSGIATLTHQVQSMIAHTNCKVLDTRKTTPNFRIPEKWAVEIGGGVNHRMGLYDMILIKDNHIDYCGSVDSAIKKSLEYLSKNSLDVPIVVETRDLDEVDACLIFANKLERILLDNMSSKEILHAVQHIQGRIPTEASGGITLKNVKEYAETGVDFISMGSIIYDAHLLDMSMKSHRQI